MRNTQLKWSEVELRPNGNDYTATITSPSEGYRGYVIELTYRSGNILFPYKFSTPGYVVPNKFPCNMTMSNIIG
jgi:hypothetical protein